MSGIMAVMLGSGGKPLYNLPSGILANDVTLAPALASAYIYVYDDGYLKSKEHGIFYAKGTWYAYAPQAGAGSGMYVKLSGTGDTPVGYGLDTWYEIALGPGWGLTCNNNSKIFTGTLYLSTSASDAGIIDSCGIDIYVESSM